MERLIHLSRFTYPSTGPVLQARANPARTTASSFNKPVTNLFISGMMQRDAWFHQLTSDVSPCPPRPEYLIQSQLAGLHEVWTGLLTPFQNRVVGEHDRWRFSQEEPGDLPRGTDTRTGVSLLAVALSLRRKTMFLRSRRGWYRPLLSDPDDDHLGRTGLTHPLYFAPELDAIVASLLQSLGQVSKERGQHTTRAIHPLGNRGFLHPQRVMDCPTTEFELPANIRHRNPLCTEYMNLSRQLLPIVLNRCAPSRDDDS